MRPILTPVLLLFTLLLTTVNLQAQDKIDIKGQVVDSSDQALVAATVILLQAADSTFESFGQTDDNGQFKLPRIRKGEYRLQISYVGYTTYNELIKWPSTSELDLGKIKLEPESKTLSEVTVEADRIPMQFQGDTIAYNADAFKVQPNAVVEDLLKRLPGVEVEDDGSIKAQGETVNRVLVDGKEFFGNDPKMATKNLPAEIVDKVKVYDKKSDQAEFTGIDDGQEEKTINLELKEDKKKGIFGRLMAGGGDQDRFQSKVNLNRFSPKSQLSFIGLGNNINDKGFSVGDYLNFMGGMRGLSSGRVSLNFSGAGNVPFNFGSNDGFIRTLSGGLNFNQDFSEKTELNGSYFYSDIDTDIKQTVDQQTFLSDRTIGSFTETDQNTRNQNHRLNFTLDQDINKNSSLKWRGAGSIANTTNNSVSTSLQTGQETVLNTENTRLNQSIQENQSFNSSLLYRLKLGKPGRTLSSNFSLNLGDSQTDANLSSDARFFGEDNALISQDSILQVNDFTNQQLGYGAKLTYTEPILPKTFLEASYEWNRAENDVDQSVFDQVDEDLIFNQQLSNQFENANTYNNAGLKLRWNSEKIKITTGLQGQNTNINGNLLLTNTEIDRSFFNWLPNFRFDWELGTARNFGLRYNTSVNEPTIRQLQPIVDNSDPFNIYIGNPNLKPEFRHQVSTNFMIFDQFSYTSFFSNISFTYTKNKITNIQSIDEFLIRTNTPLNVEREYGIRGSFSFSKRIRPLDVTIRINSNINFNRGITFINELENQTTRNTISNSLIFSNRKKEILDWTIEGKWAVTTSKYSINTNFNQDFLNQTYKATLGLTFIKGWDIRTNFDYRLFGNITDSGLSQEVPIWNASVSKFIFKDDRGEIKLQVRDILNRNLGVNRTANLNFIQETTINSLARYVMVSFTYNLKGFGGNGIIIAE